MDLELPGGRRVQAGQAASPAQVAHILAELQALASASGGGAETVYLPAGADGARESLKAQWAARSESAESGFRRAAEDGVGAAVFRVGAAGLLVIPPFPLTMAAEQREPGIRQEPGVISEPGINGGPLLALLARDYTVGVALLRLGRYAIAVYEGRRLAASKTDTRYVKGRHHAGGTSQRRFQRVREWQIHRLYAEAAGVLQRQWQPWLPRLDYVALGGEAATLAGFVKECPLLGRLAPITLRRRLAVREPNRAALDGSVKTALYQCRLYPLGQR